MKLPLQNIRVFNCLVILAFLCALILTLVPPNKGIDCKIEVLTEKRTD
jgi:hypothetical protein